MEKKCENCSRYQNNWCQSRFKCQNYIYFKPKLQTNRQWLMTLSDEELARLLIENTPTCDDDYGWEDRYTNPCDRKYKEIPYDSWYGYGYEEEVFNTDYEETIKEIVQWLQAEHKE